MVIDKNVHKIVCKTYFFTLKNNKMICKQTINMHKGFFFLGVIISKQILKSVLVLIHV